MYFQHIYLFTYKYHALLFYLYIIHYKTYSKGKNDEVKNELSSLIYIFFTLQSIVLAT